MKARGYNTKARLDKLEAQANYRGERILDQDYKIKLLEEALTKSNDNFNLLLKLLKLRVEEGTRIIQE